MLEITAASNGKPNIKIRTFIRFSLDTKILLQSIN